jgi:hypothetical protein
MNEKIINPALIDAFRGLDTELAELPVIGSFNLFILGIIIFAAIVETITVIVKACKYGG